MATDSITRHVGEAMEESKFGPGGDQPVETIECRPAPSQRILFVDDESPIREFVTEVLGRSGYHVDAAEDGAVAWDILQSNHYDLLITDNVMPNASGVELLQNLRTVRPGMPVIMATGTRPHGELMKDPGIQPSTLLLKPYTGAEMLRAVNSILLNQADENAATLSR